mgnify:FL=1
MTRARFRTIAPKLLPIKVFQDNFEKAARLMEKDVKAEFEKAVSKWKHQPYFRGYVRIDANRIYLSVGTQDLVFKFQDLGTKAHIIRPKRAKVLHWVAPTGDVFAKEVHHPGTKAQEISKNIQETFADGLMAEYFDDALVQSVMESGHAI